MDDAIVETARMAENLLINESTTFPDMSHVNDSRTSIDQIIIMHQRDQDYADLKTLIKELQLEIRQANRNLLIIHEEMPALIKKVVQAEVDVKFKEVQAEVDVKIKEVRDEVDVKIKEVQTDVVMKVKEILSAFQDDVNVVINDLDSALRRDFGFL